MMILTRSRRIRRALRVAFRRIPTPDRRRVETFLVWIKAERGWQLRGLNTYLEQTSAGLYPLYHVGDRTARPGGQIIFQLPVCHLFTDAALVGIVAHELAHALQATRLTGDWHARMQRRYTAGERDADHQAVSWGFTREIQTYRRERRQTVTPFFEANEGRLFRLVLRRQEREHKEDVERFRQLAGE